MNRCEASIATHTGDIRCASEPSIITKFLSHGAPRGAVNEVASGREGDVESIEVYHALVKLQAEYSATCLQHRGIEKQ